jgi:hypothetical protein
MKDWVQAEKGWKNICLEEGGREGSMKLESVRFSCLWVEFVCCLFYIPNAVQPGKRGGLEICTILLISQHYLTNISFSFLSYFFYFFFQNILNYYFFNFFKFIFNINLSKLSKHIKKIKIKIKKTIEKDLFYLKKKVVLRNLIKNIMFYQHS